jgi:serine/threonine-protein kinase
MKPANIVHADATTVKVVDFGVVRMLEETTDSFSLTATHAVIGTAAYLSPEQAGGAPVDERSDLYGLGCVLFTLLTDQAPFIGDSAVAVLGQHLHSAPPSLATLRPDTPPALVRLVDELLAKDPAARPPTAADVARRLTAITAGGDTAILPTVTVDRRRRSRPTLAAAGVAVLVVAAVAVAVALMTGDDSPVADRPGTPRPSASRSATSPSPSPSPTPSPSRPPLSTPAAAITAFRAGLARATAAGAIDDKGAQDLTHRLDDLAKTVADPAKADEAAKKVADLAKHIDDLTGKGQISAEGRRLLDRPLSALERMFPDT